MQKQTTKKFLKGLGEVRVCQIAKCREELMQALGVTTRQALWNYSKGAYRLDVEVAAKIEQIFLKYDVKNPWGDTPLKS